MEQPRRPICAVPVAAGAAPSRDDLEAARRRLDRLAHLLDSAFRVPGTSVRIGADAMLNVLPGIGTLAAKGLSSYIIFEARRLGAPKATLIRMCGNLGVDFVLSAIPVVGWASDVFFRANTRNLALLRAHLDRVSAVRAGA